MAYTTISAGQTDADSPLDQTLMDALRLNGDYLNTQVMSLFAFGNSGIIDDFMGKDGAVPDTGSWTVVAAGGGSSSLIQASTHSLNIIANGATVALARAADGRIGMHMANHELTSVLQFRIKESFLGGMFFLGWQDRSLADTSTRATTVADCIGLLKGTGTSWKFRFANGGTSTEVDSLGTPGSWTIFRMTTTCSATAASRVVRCETGTVDTGLSDISGSPWTNTSSMPVGKYLSPSFCCYDAGNGVCNFLLDYVLAYTTARPLSP